MIKPICDKCNKELLEPGAILLSPPDKKGWVRKYHICVGCYKEIKPTQKQSPPVDNSVEKYTKEATMNKKCIWCGIRLKDAPTNRWHITSANKKICHQCILTLAKQILIGMESEIKESDDSVKVVLK